MQYYLINVNWTSQSEKEIISSFIVESLSVKDAISKVLLKHSFHLLDERLTVAGTEVGLAMQSQNSCVLAIGNTVRNA